MSYRLWGPHVPTVQDGNGVIRTADHAIDCGELWDMEDGYEGTPHHQEAMVSSSGG